MREVTRARGLVGMMTALLVFSPGCKGHGGTQGPSAGDDPAVVTALRLVDQVRQVQQGPGMDPMLLDLSLMEDLRRLEVTRAAERRKAPKDEVQRAFDAARPDEQVPAIERARRYASNAGERLKHLLQGSCTAEREPLGTEMRVGALSAPLAADFDELKETLSRVRRGLHGATLVAVKCERGAVGMLLVPTPTGFRIVDVVPTGRSGSSAPIRAPPGSSPPRAPAPSGSGPAAGGPGHGI